MDSSEIRRIDRIETDVIQDKTRYDNAFSAGQYTLAQKIAEGMNQKEATLRQLYARERELRQQAQAHPAPLPQSKFGYDIIICLTIYS